MAEAGEILVKLSADISNLQRGLNQAVSGITNLQNSVKETTRQTSAFTKVMEIAGGVAAGQILYEGMRKATSATKGYVASALQAASRSEEMSLILATLGKRHGVSTAAIENQIEAMQELGIQTDVAQNTLAEFIRRQIDFSKASALARTAQDLARITNSNSSETLQELIYAIRTGNSQLTVMQELGVQSGDAMKKFAAANNTTVESLSPLQREGAILNAILEAGQQQAGLYAASMTTSGKRAQSLARHFFELKKQLGDALLPAFGEGVRVVEEWVTSLRNATQAGAPLRRILDAIGKAIADKISQLVNFARQVGPAISSFVKKLQELQIGELIGRNISAIVSAFNSLRAPLLEVGKVLLPVVATFLRAITPIIQAISSAIQKIPVPVLTGALAAFISWKLAVGPLQKVLSILSGSAAATNAVGGLAKAVSMFVLNIRTAPSLAAGLGGALKAVHPVAIAVAAAVALITWNLQKLKAEARLSISAVEKGIRARTTSSTDAIVEVNKEIAAREKLLKTVSKEVTRDPGPVGGLFMTKKAEREFEEAGKRRKQLTTLPEEISALKALKEQLDAERTAANQLADDMFNLDEIFDDLGGTTDDLGGAAKNAVNMFDALKQAIDETTGAFLSSLDATSSYHDAIDEVIQSVNGFLPQSRIHARSQREFESIVRSALQAIEAEALALAEAGRIGKDAASVMAFIRGRTNELRSSLSELAKDTRSAADEFEHMNAAIDSVSRSLDQHLNVYLDAVDSTTAFEEAVFGLTDALNMTEEAQAAVKDKLPYFDPVTKTWYEQARAVAEVNKKTRDARASFTRVIRAIEEEALALARAGEIGSDMASIHAHIQSRLEQLRPIFPELVGEINRYSDRIKAIPPTSITTFKPDTGAAIGVINDYAVKLRDVPDKIESIVRVAVDTGGIKPPMDKFGDELWRSANALDVWSQRLEDINRLWAQYKRSGGTKPSIVHEGGVVAHKGMEVPSFHGDRLGRTGGIKRDERLALLQTGEGVLSRKVMALLGPTFEFLRRGEINNFISNVIGGVRSLHDGTKRNVHPVGQSGPKPFIKVDLKPGIRELADVASAMSSMRFPTVPVSSGGNTVVHIHGIDISGVETSDPKKLARAITDEVRNEMAKTQRRNVTTGLK